MTELTHPKLVLQGGVGEDHHLEATKKVLDKGPSVGADRHVAVELSETGLGYLCPVFTNVLLPQVELQRGVGDKVKWLRSPEGVGKVGAGAWAGEKGTRKKYLGREVSPLGSALVM